MRKKSKNNIPQNGAHSAVNTSIDITPEVSEAIAKVERIIKYEFKDKRKIASALTHPSYEGCRNYLHSYERLEFLGDSILGAVVADQAYRQFRKLTEGGLTRVKIGIVTGETLASVSQQIGLAEMVLIGKLPPDDIKRGLESAAEDIFEAVVGALFLDGGFEVARKFIIANLGDLFDVSLAAKPNNAKSELQEELQRYGASVEYEVISAEGPPHDRIFSCRAVLNDKTIGTGSGNSKKAAETEAALEALARPNLKQLAQ